MDEISRNFLYTLEENSVEYFLFPPINNHESLSYSQIYLRLLETLNQCEKIVGDIVEKRNYIWHKDEFRLHISTGDVREKTLNEIIRKRTDDFAECLPPHLYGVTHFGDDITDEWFIVYLLKELSEKVTGSIVRVVDSDGEFLLIEAAEILPKWANPDSCKQRVYVINGGVQLVQNSPSHSSGLIPVSTAITKIRENLTLYCVSKEVQECINKRTDLFKHDSYPPLFRHIVRLPLRVAGLLQKSPGLIAPAVRAFCERDFIDMKACHSMRYFPPEQQRVRVNVLFTRCLYAMLMKSKYIPDAKIGWNLSKRTESEEYKEDLLGVKIACGFEILTSQAKEACNDQEKELIWNKFVQKLFSKDFFKNINKTSEEYQQLLDEAKQCFNNHIQQTHTKSTGKHILELLDDMEFNIEQFRSKEEKLQPSDPDKWLDIEPEQLEGIFLDNIRAEDFTTSLVSFLEKESTFNGIDNSAMYSEDLSSVHDTIAANKMQTKEDAQSEPLRKSSKRSSNSQTNDKGKTDSKADIDESNANIQIRNLLDFVIPEDNWDSNSEMSDYEDEDDVEQNIEATCLTDSTEHIDGDIKAYMAQMDQELARTTIGQTFQQSSINREKVTATTEDDFNDIEDFEPINININTLQNIMHSYEMQYGGPGPVSHLLNAMGVGMSTAAENKEKSKDLKESTL